MAHRVRTVLALEGAAFAAASLVHSGLVVSGHEHWKAATAELVIAVVLLAGLAAGVASPRSTRAAALAVQGFALLGTLVGIFTIAIGVGPRSTFDYALHAGFVSALVAGLVLVARGRARAPSHA
jgi:predicted ferric reductase